MNISEEMKKVFEIEIEELNKLKDRINNNYDKIFEEILNCHGNVVLTGIGKSGIIAKKISATLASTGTPSIFMNSAEALHGDLGMVRKDDIVIAISNSGNSEEVVSILGVIKKIGAKIIAMTGNKKSQLALNSDYIIDIGVEKEACPMNLAPTSSTTATLVMGDAIASVLIKLRNFKPENFALYHPGGSLGRKLLTRVKDMMNKNLPLVNLKTSIDEVIMELTNKKLGAVCVLENEKVMGIITEGDIRRALKNKDKFFNFRAEDIMTKKYLYTNEDSMAVEALEIMENRESQISVLPVFDKENKLRGMIRIHDLVGMR